MKKVSIIVPIYNVEKYIEKCVQSLISQDYSEIEIILVDDGSPDKSGEIIDRMANGDGRIVVLHKTNGGVSSARNAGLDVATGDYIMFVDGDDWVEPEYVSYFLRMTEETEAKIGMNSANYVNEGFETNASDYSKIISSETAMEKIYLGGIFVAVWNKIYDLNYIKENGIRFNDDIWYGEGMLFNIQALQNVETVVLGDRKVYHQITNPNSAMRKFNLESQNNGIQSMHLQRKCWKKVSKKLEKAWKLHLWQYNWHIISGLQKTHQVQEYKGEYKACKRAIRKGAFLSWQINIPIKAKLIHTILGVAPNLCVLALKIKIWMKG